MLFYAFLVTYWVFPVYQPPATSQQPPATSQQPAVSKRKTGFPAKLANRPGQESGFQFVEIVGK